MQVDDVPEAARRPKVSVVIPVKDDAEELRCCLQALSGQSLPPEQIIVVDNNSTDHSADVARAFGAEVVFCAQPGIPAAASAGYDHAGGDLILRIDADSLPDHHWVEIMVAAFANHPQAGAVTGGATFYDGPQPLRIPLAVLYLGAYRIAGVLALGHWPLFGSNMGLRRDVWEQVRDQIDRSDTDVHDDLALSYPVGALSPIHRLGRPSMQISMRPFYSANGFRLRFRRAVHTVTSQWPQDFPPYRWRRIAAARSATRNPAGALARQGWAQ